MESHLPLLYLPFSIPTYQVTIKQSILHSTLISHLPLDKILVYHVDKIHLVYPIQKKKDKKSFIVELIDKNHENIPK
jgi:hypothetical protein